MINKIDLPAANLPLCYEQMEEILALPREEALCVSGKTGEGVPELLRAIVERIPHPTVTDEPGSSALIFDSNYDSYRGVVNYVRVRNGVFRRGSHEYLGKGIVNYDRPDLQKIMNESTSHTEAINRDNWIGAE